MVIKMKIKKHLINFYNQIRKLNFFRKTISYAILVMLPLVLAGSLFVYDDAR